jgi:hypothetical protein
VVRINENQEGTEMNDDIDPVDSTADSYEEEYFGYEIYIEKNKDRYRGGFEWFVCKDENELDVGLSFSTNDALTAARNFVDSVRTPLENSLERDE